jgi:hypothetical protein
MSPCVGAARGYHEAARETGWRSRHGSVSICESQSWRADPVRAQKVIRRFGEFSIHRAVSRRPEVRKHRGAAANPSSAE